MLIVWRAEVVELARLYEKVRLILERIVRNLSRQETVSGIGLFGSWSRGDAVSGSDVDLLVISEQNFNYEYLNRLKCDDLFVDLNYIPEKWLRNPISPEIDQKLYEVVVLYDRDWLLTNTKDWMSQAYLKPGRVGVRTGTHLVESDIYLSRATSAYARRDFQSVCVFASMGLESVLKILVEISLLPMSNSHFIEVLERSTNDLGHPKFFAAYLAASQLYGLSRSDAERKLDLFRATWEHVASFMKDNASVLDSLHFKVKSKLKYYGKPAFLQGMIARSQEIIDAGLYTEASHYVLSVMVDLLENYAWLVSALDGVKLDYTTLFRFLRGLKETPRIYELAVEAFDVGDVSQKEAEGTLKLVKETVLDVRRQRKDLINSLTVEYDEKFIRKQ